MIQNCVSTRRRGSILPVVALLIVGLCGFVALSVEVATVATVKAQCQNAADAAALAGARTLDGSSTPKTAQAQTNALATAAANKALGADSSGTMAKVAFNSSEIGFTAGTYHYNSTLQQFSPAYTLATGENYNLVKVTAQRAIKNSFFIVTSSPSASAANSTILATGVAAHRPRDVAVVLDFSGSMNNESDLWNCESYLGGDAYQSNNPDTIVPTFGHYISSTAALVSTLSSPGGSSNITQPNGGMPALVDSYLQSARGASSVNAFTAATSSYASAPLGDIPVTKLNTGSGTNFATNVNDIFGTNLTTSYPTTGSGALTFSPLSFEGGSLGYYGYDFLYHTSFLSYGTPAAPSGRNALSLPGFSGYTAGPAYWGKTFFTWPPDPRAAADWRQLYFTDASNNPVVNNTTLWDSSGAWIAPNSGSTNFHINYKAILNWIKNIGPNPFPATLRAGQTIYYSSIPTDVPAAAYDHSQPNSNITDPSTRFWKEYIDFCLGCWRDPYGNVQTPGNPTCSYGPDYTWGTVQISAKPSGSVANNYKLAYMNYKDNPQRPRHRMWFGPMTMLQYIADTGINPGTARDVSTYSAKLGIASVLQDMQLNHPNDMVSLVYYNRPQFTGDPPIGKFTQALTNLSQNYTAATNALWYPPNSGTSDVTPWDVNGAQTPNSYADFTSNTTTNHGLMLAYNQFSSSSTLSGNNIGGFGRVGAKRLVILETDGMTNATSYVPFVNNTNNSAYWNLLPGQPISGTSSFDQNALYQCAQAICNTSSGVAGTPNTVVSNPGYPGFATANKPVVIQTIAFGIVFQINTSTQSAAVTMLQNISQIGGTTFPSSPSDPTNGYKWCVGDLSTRVQLLQQAFSNVLDDGNSVSLIQ
jgi:Flp pilus assembly protein TadG